MLRSSPANGWKHRLQTYFVWFFGADIRSLALLRFLLGMTVAGDLLDRARDLSAHYTDHGIVSRELVLQTFWNEVRPIIKGVKLRGERECVRAREKTRRGGGRSFTVMRCTRLVLT